MFPLKPYTEADDDYQHDYPDQVVTVHPLELRHMPKIHTIYSHYKCKRDKKRGYDSQNLHDAVHLLAHRVKVDVLK